MQGEQQSWDALRHLSDHPPGLAEAGARAETFRAAIRQAESLWRVSGEVGPAVSPVLLYGGLVQAGRSACSALDPSDDWDSSSGHGIRLSVSRGSVTEGQGLSSVSIGTTGSGLLEQVASLFGSPTLSVEEVSLLMLVSSIPSTTSFVENPFMPRPIAIQLDDLEPPLGTESLALSISLLPEELWRPHVGPNGTTEILPPDQSSVVNWLSAYPTLAQLGTPEVGRVTPISFDQPMQCSIRLTWSIGPLSFFERRQMVKRWVGADLIIDSDYLISGSLSPVIGGNTKPLHPIITWWLILYGFSKLARTYARNWTAFIGSRDALAIGRILDVARVDIPSRLLTALTDL